MLVISAVLFFAVQVLIPIPPMATSDIIIEPLPDNGVTDKDSKEKATLPGPDEFIAVDKMPELVKQITPVYPKKALKKGLEGDVWVKMLISQKGDVLKAMVSKDSGKKCGFEEAALEASKEFKFSPAIQNKQPVMVWVTQKVSFRLDDKKTDSNK